ncbi:hypothetical protein GLAREA_11261 [Glarea lozoyensis ATCC 20868]|uniref:DUF7918 domain-containing protein n=1 Tax=Glarea lozoyensis (strain ATCC 20868 / MF5171) TaxID=1116229 RepID=S3DUC0_GLAL2|nr:uncharacterized protein GLAREA_11261 [Glarea lozoyensis ATCC 20868]EPE35561.1 hypothetical protein GLAREA_11261 [Glarea lozoyensis ATCC 20868]
MAVLDIGLQVQIRVDGQPLKEYRPEVDEESSSEKKCIQYVECLTDKEFEINMSVLELYKWDSPALKCRIYLDGAYVASSTLLPQRKITTCGGFTEDGFVKTFVFSKINTVSDESSASNFADDVQSLSKIEENKVLIDRVSRAISKPAPNPAGKKDLVRNGSSGNDSLIPSVVHEKAMKGEVKSHGVTFASKPVPESKSKGAKQKHATYKTTYLDDPKFPLGVFKFKYRSKESLQQLLVIPRTPEPEDVSEVPDIKPVDLQGLSADERKDVEEHIRRLKTSNDRAALPALRVKHERGEEENQGGLNKRAKASQREIEVVDLIDD